MIRPAPLPVFGRNSGRVSERDFRLLKQLFSQNRQASQAFILVTVFLDVLGIGLIIPVLPALAGQFAHSPDEQSAWYGWHSAMYGTMQFFMASVLGALSDKYGRRPVLLLSISGLGISFFTHALATSLFTLLLVRVISGGTAASFSVANAYIADITEPELRGKAFGKLGAAFGIGFIFGPVLGGLLSAHNIRLPFIVAGGMAVLNWLYGYFVLPESLPKDRRALFAFKRANPFAALAHLGKVHGVGLLVVVFALAIFAQLTLQSTWVLYTQFCFHWTPQDNGWSLFAVGVVAAIVQGGLQGPLIKRFGERKLVMMGFLSATVAYLLYGSITVGWLMYVVMGANALVYAAGLAMQTIISKAVGPREQGLMQGSLNSIQSLALIVGALLGTTILARVGHLSPGDWRLGSTFYFCSFLSALALLIAWLHFRREGHLPASQPYRPTLPALALSFLVCKSYLLSSQN